MTKPGYGKFYVDYVANVLSGLTHVAQYQVSGDPATSKIADTTPSTIKTLLTVTQPQTNHNGGWIGFSPRANDDHNLYIALGDGGNGDDIGSGHTAGIGNAQDITTMLGKMLRLHVDPATGTYSIPSDNPYAISSITNVQKEIWLLGLRNPYRDSFDRGTGRMYIGDVGQSSREEVDAQEPANSGGGENYGWRDREGTIQNPTYATATPTPTPTPVPPRVNPIVDYPRNDPGNGVAGRTCIGGYVYRGKQIPALNGTYIFGDYLGPNGSTAKIFALNYNGTAVSNLQDITSTVFTGSGYTLANPTGFGEDANGEIYIADISTGSVYRIAPVTPFVSLAAPILLGSGNVAAPGNGVPFQSHTIQATNDLVVPFGNIGTATAAGDGSLQFTDTGAANLSMRFYRAKYP
ncbi:MAG: PQQ-dependent sugar dehydrogenase [Verrucomicrobiota bacterium]|nr:PQQ-dependent sugar dehydrogenase [Verrucomicrobiota bacterium]